MNSGTKNKNRVSVEEFSYGLYEIALGVAAKMQQELLGQQSLDKYRQQIDDASLGFLASSLWLVNQVAQRTISRNDFRERSHRALMGKFFDYMENATGGQLNKKELQDYLNQLYAIYDRAWSDTRDPGRTWWLANAMAKEILNEPNVPELAIVILVGEAESTLAMGARLTRQYILF
jgi:hypothetical protein